MSDDEEVWIAAQEYARCQGTAILSAKPLGFGEDGIVWESERNTVIKSHYREKNYLNERDCYLRFQDCDVSEIAGFSIPELRGYDDQLMVIEIGMVTPPWVLDFGKAYLDRPGDFSELTLRDTFDQFRENYSPADWDRVLEVVSDLKSFQIYYYDLKPGNIRVRNDDDS